MADILIIGIANWTTGDRGPIDLAFDAEGIINVA